MPWPVHPTGFFGARGDSDTYRIERSLRFNSADSAYLNRTFGTATDQDVFTFSAWCKRGALGAAQQIFSVSTNHNLGFTSGDALNLTFAGSSALTTTALYRDPSAWYHIIWTQNVNAHTLYVNGVSAGTATATSNTFNTAVAHAIGRVGTTNYLSAYLSEIHFIDGQALTPSSFGETDAITGRWKAKAYSGTYGTNGFYLSFKDNTSTTTLGYDDAGSNDWTLNNFSVTAGAGNDSLVDSPTNYGTDTGVGGNVRGNYCTLSAIDKASSITLTNGNLSYSQTSSAGIAKGTLFVNSGKWYWEMESNGTANLAGIASSSASYSDTYAGSSAESYGYYGANGRKYNNSVNTSYGSTYGSGDVIGVALDMDVGSIVFYKNNSSQGTAFTGLSGSFAPAIGNAAANTANFNFGQRPFAYTAPTGFKALCTKNFAQPTIQKPSKYMDALAYTGTGASNSISSLGFSPDLVWIKNRGTTTNHAIYDTTRGTQAQLSSNTTGDEVTSSTGLTSFDANGFTIGTSTLVNTSGTQYVAWGWDESVQAGFDIVSYTGNGANRTIAHNLGVAPKMIIVKARTTAGVDQGWPVWHTSIANTTYLTLSTTSATATGTDYWNSTSPTSSVFSLGTNVAVNANNDTYISYLFSEIEGYSKFGSYTGNNSADGPFIWCGFRPRWVIIKRIDANAKPWCIHDTGRDISNVSNSELEANSSTAENGGTYPGDLDILSNGFKLREAGTSAWINEPGNFIFAAFAESPFKYARAR